MIPEWQDWRDSPCGNSLIGWQERPDGNEAVDWQGWCHEPWRVVRDGIDPDVHHDTGIIETLILETGVLRSPSTFFRRPVAGLGDY